MTRPFFAEVPAEVRKIDRSAFFARPAAPATHPFASDPSEIVDGTYARGDLEAAFSAIQNPEHWKLAIGPVAIPADLLGVASAACAFFTGSRLTVEAATADRWAVVTAPGYYATIGA